MTRITLLCNDTRGGVQPYAALARGLKAAGHEVSAVAPAGLAGLFDPGIPVTALDDTEDAIAFAATGVAEAGTRAAMRLVAQESPLRLAGWSRTVMEATEGAEVLTGGIGGMAIGLAVAEKRRLPFVPTQLQPVGHASFAYPGVLFPQAARFGPLGRWASHLASDAGVWLPFRSAMARLRRDTYELRGRHDPRAGQPVIYGFSRHVVPMSETALRHVTGYWTLPAGDWQPDPALAAFVAAAGPVVSLGFGSMGSADPTSLADLVRAAARTAGVRVVLLTGGGQADALVHPTGGLPHDWLFPRMTANVHHGGAGTTGTALAAGRPSLVVPFAVDQPFWGARVAALGVGPAAIPRRSLTVAGLADAFRRLVSDTAMADRAAALGRKLRADDGVTAAVAVFDRRF